MEALEKYHELATESASSSSTNAMIFCYDHCLFGQLLSMFQIFEGYMRVDIAKKLWDVCILQPLSPSEQKEALSWFQNCAESDKPFDCDTIEALLNEKLCMLNPCEMSQTAFTCFKTYFYKVIYFTLNEYMTTYL